MRNRFLSASLLLILLVQNHRVGVAAVEPAGAQVPAASNVRVRLNTLNGKIIAFKPPPAGNEAPPPVEEIPHLVLRRNGVPTPGFERTLVVTVTGLSVPPSGLYVELVIETQHGDPDLETRDYVRIRVHRELRFLAFDPQAQQPANVDFRVTFDPVTRLPHKALKTPTGYYRYRIALSDALGNRLETYTADYAFLMESQWRVPLPDVLEAAPGSAPAKLLLYYCDMLPFQTNPRERDSRLPRQDVDRYIQAELIPAMVEAFRVQSVTWGFPWYPEWSGYRPDEDPKTLSVALGSRETWFHGAAPSLGHAMISIRVDGVFGEYSNLTDGILSVFHHELFHNQQRNISLHFGSQGRLAGREEAWQLFSEGTAVLASSVGQPNVQFERGAPARSYLKRANAFLGSEGARGGGLNKSYRDMPYQTALYWRFLYENCGGLSGQSEDPAAGMRVIRHALEALYAGRIVQIDSSMEVARFFPRIVDQAIRSTPSCRFESYQDSLVHFAQAIYLLRLEDGRSTALAGPACCALRDPGGLYATPPADVYPLSDAPAEIRGSIPSSYGIDLIELTLGPAARDRSLELSFSGGSGPEFQVEVWKTRTIRGGPRRLAVGVSEPLSLQTENGSLLIEIEEPGSDDSDGLALIITRLDSLEDSQKTGDYSIRMNPK